MTENPTDPYDQGWLASMDDNAPCQNPYPHMSDAALRWELGYQNGINEDIDNLRDEIN